MISERRGATRTWLWPAVFCGYFAFHTLYRWGIGGGLGLDEAQMFLWGQYLAWGYGPQPPLYSWLQWGAFQLVGDPLLGLSLVKNLLLCTTCLCVYGLLRTNYPPGCAGLATAGLVLLPQIAWESQRALSHSVLATAMAALTCLVFWTRTLSGKPAGYLAFGLVAGVGLLSKANYALVPPALVLAALTTPDLRRRLQPIRLAGGAGVAAVVAAGPTLWILRNQEEALASTYKLRIEEEAAAFMTTAIDGLLAVAGASALFLAVPAAVAGLIFWRFGNGTRCTTAPTLQRFLIRTVLAGLALTLAVVIASATTEVKDRWMQPVLFLGGPLIALWLLARVGPAGQRWYRRTLALCATLVILILPIELRFGTPGNPVRGGTPIEALAPRIAQAFPDTRRIIGDPEWVAANLEYRHPAWHAEPAHAARIAPGASALLVWAEEETRGAKLASKIGARSGKMAELGETLKFTASYAWQPAQEFKLFAAPIALGE